MKGLFWFVILGLAVAVGWLIWHSRRKLEALRKAEEERFAAFMAETAGRAPATPPALPTSAPPTSAPASPLPSSPAAATGSLTQQKLLFEAAHKAGEAGEPALAIQLFARLLARYPDSGFAAQARAGVDAQKKKLPKA
jgi:TolA-binding protein